MVALADSLSGVEGAIRRRFEPAAVGSFAV